MIDNIEIIEGCFGSDVTINGKSLEFNEYNDNNKQEIIELRKLLINELIKISDKISMNDLRTIAEIITTISDNYEYSEEESNYDYCEQCGNTNFFYKFVKSK